ncbi:inositol monophosphatase family protein [Kribbella sp. NPDC050124]|uniref:inositol monophosphatase family protein n=1 Tax=Kribbella sp. NPDC050124 TaxID=3364114 RepID=UPI0037877DEC
MEQLTDAEVAIEAAAAGAAVVRRMYGATVERYDKSPTDFATEADLHAERAILEVIRAARPDDAVIGEEYGATGRAARTWLVDPLCGTLNFAARTPLFSVNVALPATGVAAVADPLTHELFWTDGTTTHVRHATAHATADATTDADSPAHSPAAPPVTDVPAEPSATSLLVDVDIDAPPDADFLGAQLLADEEFRAAFAGRVSSTTLTLAWVAVGRRAAYITDGTLIDSVHFTAGTALCQAAGCTVTDFRGDPLHTGPGLIAAADPATHRRLLDLIAPHLR